jgi:hypothetical protein
MGGMTPEGMVYILARRESLTGSHGIKFLIHSPRVAGKRLLVIRKNRRFTDGRRSTTSCWRCAIRSGCSSYQAIPLL